MIRTANARHRLLVDEKRTYLTTAMAAQAAVQMRRTDPERRWILAAPFIGLRAPEHRDRQDRSGVIA